MILLMGLVLCQVQVEAGPARALCEGSPLTLAAGIINPPDNYEIRWQGAGQAGIFYTVEPKATTSYTVTLTDLDSGLVYQDSTRVFVHPSSADLFEDGLFNDADWAVFFQAWAGSPNPAAVDADGDGSVSILDWFYFCNYSLSPPNTPPSLIIEDSWTFSNENKVINFQVQDFETSASLNIVEQPAHGLVFLNGGDLNYFPDENYVGPDQFFVQADDGVTATAAQPVRVDVRQPDTWSDIYNDIFVSQCRACHIEAAEGGLSLANYMQAQFGGDNPPGFVPGEPLQSRIYLRVADGTMPRGLPALTQQEIERIYEWIIRGALP